MFRHEDAVSVQTLPYSAIPLVTRTLGPGLAGLAIVIAGLAVGIVASWRPPLAIAAAVAIVLLPVIIARPIVGLAALLFMSFLEAFSSFAGGLSATKMLGAVLVLAWLTFVTTRQGGVMDGLRLVTVQPVLAAALVLLTAWLAMSFAWATSAEAAQTSFQRFVLNFMLFPIAIVAIRAPRHVLWLAGIFVAGALTSAALGFASGSGGGARLAGAGVHPNQLGSYLVVAMIFGAALGANRSWAPIVRILAFAAAGLAAVAVFLTLSRGALLGMGVALLAAPFLVGQGRRLVAILLAVVVVAGTVGWFTAVASASARERVMNASDAGGAGRQDLWRVAWRVLEDNPVLGVGAGNFPEVSVHYLLRPGATQRDTYIVDKKLVPHNIYLNVGSELGIVGLSLFVLIIVLSLRSRLRAARAFARNGDSMMDLAARAVVISLMSLVAVGFFTSALYGKQFWLLLAMGPALLAIAERRNSGSVTSLERTPQVT